MINIERQLQKGKTPSIFRKVANFGINSSYLISFGILIFVSLYFFSFIMIISDPIADLSTALLGAAIGCLMCFALWQTRDRSSFDLLIFLAFSMVIHFFPRILQYLAVQLSNIKLLYILFPLPWSKEDVNLGLTYVLLGTFMLIAGLLIGERVFYKYTSFPKNADSVIKVENVPNLFSLIVAGIFIYSINGYYTIYMGLSASANCTMAEVSAKWLIHFFSGDIYIFVVLTFFAGQFPKIKPSFKAYLFISIVIYLVYMWSLGSRGGTFRLLMMVFCLCVALQRDFKIKVLKVVALVPIFVILLVGDFFIGAAVRESRRNVCGTDFKLAQESEISGYQGDYVKLPEVHSSDGSQKSEISGSQGDPVKLPEVHSSDKVKKDKIFLPAPVARIADRIGILDYALGIVVMEPKEDVKRKYINFIYPIKNIINNAIPGVPFPEAQLMTANMMPMLYRGFDLQHVKANFLSEPYTIWGLAIIYFGWWGGLAFVFLSAVFVQLLYLSGSHSFGRHRLIFKAAFIWLVSGLYFFTAGFDHSIIVCFYALLQFITTLGIIYSINYFHGRFTKGHFFIKSTKGIAQ